MVIVKQMLDFQMYIQLLTNMEFHRMEGKCVLPVKSTMTWNPYTKLQDIILLKTVILIYITVKTSNPINVCLHYEHNNSSVTIVTSYWLLWLISLETKLKEQVPNKVAQLTQAELQEPALNFLLSAWWNPVLSRYAHTPPDDLPSPCAGKTLNSKVCGGTMNTLRMLHGYNWHTANSKIVLHEWVWTLFIVPVLLNCMPAVGAFICTAPRQIKSNPGFKALKSGMLVLHLFCYMINQWNSYYLPV